MFDAGARNMVAITMTLDRRASSFKPSQPISRTTHARTHLDSVDLFKLFQNIHHSLGDIILGESGTGSVEPDGLRSGWESDGRGTGDHGSGKSGSEGREESSEHCGKEVVWFGFG